MGTQKFLSTEIELDTNFVQAVNELMESLPKEVACRIANFHKESSEAESSNLHEEKLCSEELKSSECNNDNGSINRLATKSSEPFKNLKKIEEDLHTVDVNGCVQDILRTNLELKHVSNKTGDLLIADALVEVEDDLGDIYSIHRMNQDSNISDELNVKEMNSKHVKFTNLLKKHAGNGDCYIVPLQTSNESKDVMNKELINAKVNNFKVISEDQAQCSTINFPSINEKPIRTHWALTKITCYKDAYTYEVMRPFKKAPKKLPNDTDKVFIVIRGNEK